MPGLDQRIRPSTGILDTDPKPSKVTRASTVHKERSARPVDERSEWTVDERSEWTVDGRSECAGRNEEVDR
jgi:hypothetical protein